MRRSPKRILMKQLSIPSQSLVVHLIGTKPMSFLFFRSRGRVSKEVPYSIGAKKHRNPGSSFSSSENAKESWQTFLKGCTESRDCSTSLAITVIWKRCHCERNKAILISAIIAQAVEAAFRKRSDRTQKYLLGVGGLFGLQLSLE